MATEIGCLVPTELQCAVLKVVDPSLSHKIHRYRSLSELELIPPQYIRLNPLPPLPKAEISILIPPFPINFKETAANLVASLAQVQTFSFNFERVLPTLI